MLKAHAAYFGQLQPCTLPEGDGELARTRNENAPTETDTALMPVGWTQLQREPEAEQLGREPDPYLEHDHQSNCIHIPLLR